MAVVSVSVVRCPACQHGIDRHRRSEQVCGVIPCQCRWTPNAIAGARIREAVTPPSHRVPAHLVGPR